MQIGSSPLPSISVPNVRLLPPPYSRLLEEWQPKQLAAAGIEDGTLVAVCSVLELLAAGRLAEARRLVTTVRLLLPSAPCLLFGGGRPLPVAEEFARRASGLGLRGAVNEEIDLDLVRRSVTEDWTLDTQIVDWLTVAWPNLPVRVYGHVGRILRAAQDRGGPTPITDELADEYRRVQRLLLGHGLPSPKKWSQMLRVLPCLLRLQREPDTSIETAALQAGFPDAASFSAQTYRLTERRPGQIRSLLGWEWLMMRFLRHSRR